MAAGDNIAVTLNTLTAYDTATSISAALTANAATADTDALKQPYTILPTKANSKGLLYIQSTGAAADGNLTAVLKAGSNGMAAVSDKSITVTKNTKVVIPVDARYIGSDGKITLEVTPAATDKCLTDHALTVGYIELP